MTGKLTKRKARTVGILFSSTSSRRAFSWLLQYSSYTQNLSFCKMRTETESGQAGRQADALRCADGQARRPGRGGLPQALRDYTAGRISGKPALLAAGLSASFFTPVLDPAA